MDESSETRVTLRLSPEDLRYLDLFVESGEFSNRSDAIRRAIKDFIKARAKDVEEALAARKKLADSTSEIQLLREQLAKQQDAIERLMRR